MDVSVTSTNHVIDRKTVAEIQKKVVKQSGKHRISRFLHARSDKDTIAGWKSELNRILVVFNVRSVFPCLVAADFSLSRPSSS